MNAWKIAEYAVGILVPLGMFWLMEKMGKGTSNPARGGSQNPKQSKGALPPLRSPFSNLGHHASYRTGRKSSVRTVREAVRTAFEPLFKRFSWRFGLRFAWWTKERWVLTVRAVRIGVRW